MPDDFLVARNPEADSSLPYLVRLPLGRNGVVLKVRDTWPRTAKVYCHPGPAWPTDVETLQRVPVKSCQRRGAAIDLVLDRGRENRSQFVFTRVRGGREVIFWQTSRTAKMARPAVTPPTARASGVADVRIAVDVHEQYPWTFRRQQATTYRDPLPEGDYAVRREGRLVAVVERKSLQDLVSTVTSGKMRFVQAALASAPRAAVVVEDRYAGVFSLERVRPAVVADAIAEAQIRFPTVPIVFADTRVLAQEWAYRFFGAALAEDEQEGPALDRLISLPAGAPLPDREPTTATVRAWARRANIEVPVRGRLAPHVWEAWRRAHST